MMMSFAYRQEAGTERSARTIGKNDRHGTDDRHAIGVVKGVEVVGHHQNFQNSKISDFQIFRFSDSGWVNVTMVATSTAPN